MVEELTFDPENQERIQAVESSFGPSGRPLARPGRVLVGEGRLVKHGRRGPQPRAFFLFNDVLVYGSVSGRRHKKQQIVPLEKIQQEDLEDLEDGAGVRNQWLIRTPRKSFCVSAASHEEKQAWMEHIEACQAKLLRRPGSAAAAAAAASTPAACCMRCHRRFSDAQRRHLCQRCGLLVCGRCCRRRTVVGHIRPNKRVCCKCH